MKLYKFYLEYFYDGASSPATPALHIPEPLSITIAAYSVSAIPLLFKI